MLNSCHVSVEHALLVIDSLLGNNKMKGNILCYKKKKKSKKLHTSMFQINICCVIFKVSHSFRINSPHLFLTHPPYLKKKTTKQPSINEKFSFLSTSKTMLSIHNVSIFIFLYTTSY